MKLGFTLKLKDGKVNEGLYEAFVHTLVNLKSKEVTALVRKVNEDVLTLEVGDKYDILGFEHTYLRTKKGFHRFLGSYGREFMIETK